MNELEVTPDDETVDPGHALDEKRRAKSTYEEVVGSDPTPFLTVLSERALADIRVAEIRRSSWNDDEHWEPWNERVQADLYALLGRARLREYPAVYDRTVDAV